MPREPSYGGGGCETHYVLLWSAPLDVQRHVNCFGKVTTRNAAIAVCESVVCTCLALSCAKVKPKVTFAHHVGSPFDNA